MQGQERNQDATVFVGGLDDGPGSAAPASVPVGEEPLVSTEELLWELCVQAGPVVSVHIPKDRLSGAPSGFACASPLPVMNARLLRCCCAPAAAAAPLKPPHLPLQRALSHPPLGARAPRSPPSRAVVEFASERDADYAIRVLNMVRLSGRPLRFSKAGAGKSAAGGAAAAAAAAGVGANLFIGNLDPSLDEKALYDVFSAFGLVSSPPRLLRDPATGGSRGCGFVSYDSFEAADLAIDAMNGQFLGGRQLSVMYAYRKDGAAGERHGSAAERTLAAAARAARGPAAAAAARPNLLFAAAPDAVVSAIPVAPHGGAAGAAMLGSAAAAAARAPPPMLPPAAILPAGMPPPLPAGFGGMMAPPPPPPPPLPQPAYFGGSAGGGSFTMPPPLPPHFAQAAGMLPPPLPPPLPSGV